MLSNCSSRSPELFRTGTDPFAGCIAVADCAVMVMSSVLSDLLLSALPHEYRSVNYRFLSGSVTRNLPSLAGNSFEADLIGLAGTEGNERPPLQNCPNGRNQIGVGGPLDHIAQSADLMRLRYKCRLVVHRQENDTGIWLL